jgi:hypothetical protein
MLIRLTKQHVLTALREEPFLEGGCWLDVPPKRYEDTKFKIGDVPADCGACAVGALMRRTLAPDQPLRMFFAAIEESTRCGQITPISDMGDGYIAEAEGLLEDNEVIAALSVYFEGVFRGPVPRATRQERSDHARSATIEWVTKKFPNEFFVNIDGAAPREGIDVVVP